MIDPPDPERNRTEEQMTEAEHVEAQAQQKIEKLEDENERLREALRRVIDVGPEALDENMGAGLGGKIRRICKDALDGGGDGE